MSRNYITKAATVAVLAMAAASCFTGVESTPRIGDAEVRRRQAAEQTAEQRFLADVRPDAPSQWRRGHTAWLVSDPRFARVLAPMTAVPDSLAGRTMLFGGFAAAASLTGSDATDVTLVDASDGTVVRYRVAVPSSAIDTVSQLEVPFAIDLGLVARVDSMMRGRLLYVCTPDWFDGRGRDVSGLRHIEVTVDSVVPGSYLYPAAVYFTPTDSRQAARASIAPDDTRFLYMSVGGVGASTRSFDRLFAFDNPRRRFPNIEDDVWELITASRVREGMTRDECRLALGSPTAINRYPTRGGMREVWNYSDGVYLAFDDGYLTSFRQ